MAGSDATNLGPPNPNHPLHRSGYALETIKWGEQWKEEVIPVTRESAEQVERWFSRVLEACGIDLDPVELLRALDYYAGSFARQTGAPIFFCRSLLLDGFIQGLGLAAGLDADPPPYYEAPDA